METFDALLALCAGNSPVTGELPSQRPVTPSFDVFLDLRPNKRLSKQSWGGWFEAQSRSSWRHSNEQIDGLLMHYTYRSFAITHRNNAQVYVASVRWHGSQRIDDWLCLGWNRIMMILMAQFPYLCPIKSRIVFCSMTSVHILYRQTDFVKLLDFPCHDICRII